MHDTEKRKKTRKKSQPRGGYSVNNTETTDPLGNRAQEQILKFSDRARAKFIDLRKQSGLSLEEFGALLKVGKTTIHSIESGQNKPSLSLIDRAEDAFNVKF